MPWDHLLWWKTFLQGLALNNDQLCVHKENGSDSVERACVGRRAVRHFQYEDDTTILDDVSGLLTVRYTLGVLLSAT